MRRHVQCDPASKCKTRAGAYRRIQGQEELALLLEMSRLGPDDSEGPQIPAPDCVS